MSRLRMGIALAISAVAVGSAPAESLAGAPTDVTVIHDSANISAGQSGGMALSCSPGRAIAGGIRFQWTNAHLIASGPLDEGGTTAGTDDGEIPRFWYSSAYNGDVNVQVADFYAVCSTASDATVQASDFPTLNPDERVDTPVDCPAGQRAIGGGLGSIAELANGAGTNPRLMPMGPLDATDAIAEDGDVARGWRVGAHNTTDDLKDFVGFAVCSADSRSFVRATDNALFDPSESCSFNMLGELALGGGDLPLAAADWYPTTIAPTTQDGFPVGWHFWHDATSDQRVSTICEPPPAAAPSPSPPGTAVTTTVGLTGQRAAALAKCKKKRSKKARKKCKKKALRLPV